jgi:asparagine synthase (glutamine-hydrolysing)
MCGICGVVQVGGVPRPVVEASVLDRMTDAMLHRGPSGRGTYLADGVAFGIRRLAIVDVEGGDQPVCSEAGDVWAVHNGELYNHLSLRGELGGHRFASRCDTEVIPHLYEQYGERFPERLRGMFGIAVWDERRRRAVLCRDRLGIKPLYYAAVDDLLVFASELKSLLASGLVPDELDYDAIDAYLTLGYFPAPYTPLAAVRKLPPGHRLVVEQGSYRIEPYWRYPLPDPRPMRMEEASERLLHELEESVRLRLMSDVPLGAMLSGGLDSSLIVALMARNMDTPVKTFSVGFREDTTNELADARRIANHFATDHHELELSFHHDAVPFDELVWHLDEPVADLSTLGFYALSHLAVQDVTVALSGQGADELFGGYAKHQAAWAAGKLRRLPAPLRSAVGRAAQRGSDGSRRAARTFRATDPVDRLLAMSGDLDASRRDALYRGPMLGVDGAAARAAIASHLDGLRGDPLSTTLYLDGQLALPDWMLHYFDRMSMAHSLEVRVPFLDHHFVELAATIPPNLKVNRFRTKLALKHAARGIIPDQIIDKPKIGFFADTANRWLRTRMEDAVADHLGPDARSAEFLDLSRFKGLTESFADGSGGAPRPRLFLSVLLLEIWLSSFLDRARRQTASSAV